MPELMIKVELRGKAIRLFNVNVEMQREKKEKRFHFISGLSCIWIKMRITRLSSCKSG